MITNVKANRLTSYILVFCFLAGGLSPALSYFDYDQLAQQWYVCAFFLILLFFYFLIEWVKNDKIIRQYKKTLTRATTFVLALECLFVIFHDIAFAVRILPVVGTMDNSTGLAIHICLLLPFVFADKKQISVNSKSVNRIEWHISIVVVTLSIVTVFFTHSRTGILCILTFILIEFLFKRHNHNAKIKMAIIIVSLSVFVILNLNSTKQNSSNGRYFILSNSVELIKDRPISGYPPNGFLKVYMNKQAEYFRSNPNSKYAELADEISHPLNEFINIWINHGLLGLVLLILIVCFPIVVTVLRRQINLLCALCTILIFSFFSYPFLYPLPVLFLLFANIDSLNYILHPLVSRMKILKTKYRKILILLSGVGAICGTIVLMIQFSYCYKWNKAAYRAISGGGPETISVFEELENHYSNNPYFLYNYMSESFYSGNLDKAAELSKRLHHIMSSYNLELISGDIYYHQHKYEEAGVYYENALYMCPCRFAPLEGLYKVFEATGNQLEKQRIADIIAAKKVKVMSSDIVRIKEKCK